MPEAHARDHGATHVVTNQPPPLEPYDACSSDRVLAAHLARHDVATHATALGAYGRAVGDELGAAGVLANRYPPVFHSHDRFGHRIDQVEFHPAYHALMRAAIECGWHSLPWTAPGRDSHVARAAFEYLHHQADSGTGCPLTMTFAAVPALRHAPALAEAWLPRITARVYDGTDRPWYEKQGVTIGMAMTEKQGGTDVRANTTRAEPVYVPGADEAWALTGHKWFCSAPMCDAFLTLAQTAGGLTCFLLPRWRPDGARNGFHVQRLKDKLGNHSNASSEVEYRDAFAWRVGAEGRGVATILEMVALTRFDCMVGSAALMRQGLAQAVHHCAHRQVMGRVLAEQPLMQNVLADLALEAEGALALALRVARGLDGAAAGDARASAFVRIATAIGKYWICKRAPAHVNEAAECLGGAGYVEQSVLPRLYREAPVNSTWEGSGNVQCLDVLRAMTREPAALAALQAELDGARGSDPHYDAFVERLTATITDGRGVEQCARALVEELALALVAAELIAAGDGLVAGAWCRGRLGPARGLAYGTLPAGIDLPALVARARPQLD
ncbi:MAG: acyl-CoA dehydrogenase family protein [Gammaproteobacteria bacterium]